MEARTKSERISKVRCLASRNDLPCRLEAGTASVKVRLDDAQVSRVDCYYK